MKKTLAILLALAMVFSTLTVAFAEGTISADAQACVTLGMLKGDTSAGVTADYVAQAPTRLTAAILFLRLKGLENEALAYTGTENFADADQVAWAGGKAIMGYLKTHPELGWVGDQGKFAPNDKITAQQYYKVMLETLGYKQNTTEVIGDFTFPGVFEFAAKQGLTKVATVTNFTVNDVAIATIEALKATVKGSTKTLGTALVDANILDQAKAIAAGVYVAPVVALAVDSASATNLKEVVVTFNTAVDEDSAETVGNYVVKQGTTDRGVDTATLQEDGKTVVLTLTSDFTANQAAASVKVSNVKTAAGVKLAKAVELKFTAADNTFPVAQKVEVTGPKTLVVTFSEPVETAGAVKLDNGASYVGITVDGSNEVTLDLGVAPTEGEHNINVKSFVDYAGFKNVATDLAFSYAKDTTVPTATITSIHENTATFTFNKAVKIKSSYGTDVKLYHTINNQAAYKATTFAAPAANQDANGYSKKWVATFATPMKAGNVELYLYAKANKFEDLWGNDVQTATYNANVVTDTDAPTATIEAESDTKLVVTFNEDVVGSDARKKVNYTLMEEDGTVMTSTDYDFVDGKGHPDTGATMAYSNANDEYEATITLDSPMDPGNYKIKIQGINDLAYVPNEMEDTVLSFSVTDGTRPALSKAIINTNRDIIYVYFDEEMDVDGLDELANYGYVLNGLLYTFDADNDTVEVVNSKVVKISLNTALPTSFVDATPNDDYVAVNGRLKDLEGNEIGGLYQYVAPSSDSITTWKTDSVKLTATDKVEFKVDSLLSSIDRSDFTVGSNTVTAASFVNGSTTATVYLTLGTDVKTDASDLGNITAGAGALTTEYETDNLAFTIPAGTAIDKVAPTLDTVQLTTGDTVTLTFSEAINPATVSVLTFTVSGNAVTDVNWTNSKVLRLTLEDLESPDSTPDVTQALVVRDMNDNELAAGETTTADDKIAPRLVSVEEDSQDATVLIATFSEEVDEDLVENAANWTVVGGETIDSIVWDAATCTATINLSDALETGDTVSAHAAILDLNDNALVVYTFTK